ncbi:MAG: ATP-binding protein [Chitinophagaceae bacterium]|nr:ATP-binding protein [Chitinophagaceae bacterium]
MEQFTRSIFDRVLAGLNQQKVSLLIGARRVGKSALLEAIEGATEKKVLHLNGEDADTAAILEQQSIANYQRLLQGYAVLMIDEAQYLNDIGQKAKLMIDNIKPLHIILTGSSAFHLQQQGAPLAGRTLSYHLYPMSQMELAPYENPLTTRQKLEEKLIYGLYPEVLNIPNLDDKKSYLNELVNTYLLKDILSFEDIRHPQKILDLLKLLAFQVGSEVKIESLGNTLGISKNTVERYLDLLAKVFIIYRRTGFSRNLHKEISKSQKIYFYDNGIRNAVIRQFQPLALRQDMGALWENYLLAERLKLHAYKGSIVNSYFWRTYDQQEIDLLEETDGTLTAWELKWKLQKTPKAPLAFSKAYPEAVFDVVSEDNYLAWIGG